MSKSNLRKFNVTINGEEFVYTSDSITTFKSDLSDELGYDIEWTRHGKRARWTGTYGKGNVVEVRLVNRHAAELEDAELIAA